MCGRELIVSGLFLVFATGAGTAQWQRFNDDPRWCIAIRCIDRDADAECGQRFAKPIRRDGSKKGFGNSNSA